jgi:hypothetical protein
MKTFLRPALFVVTASVLAISAGVAQAQNAGSLQAALTQIDIGPQLEYLQDVDAGEIVIDPNAREIVLILRHAARPPLQPLEPEEIRLPLVSTKRGPCNTTYTAQRDGRAYDGPLEILKVIDYQHAGPSSWPRRPCPRPRAPVFVSYDIVTSGFHNGVVQKIRSEFSAGPLVRGPDVPPPRD